MVHYKIALTSARTYRNQAKSKIWPHSSPWDFLKISVSGIRIWHKMAELLGRKL